MFGFDFTMVPGEIVAGVFVALLAAIATGMFRAVFLLDRIKREVLPNGGASVRDVVDRVEANQATMHQRLEDHLSYHEQSAARGGHR